MVRKEKLNNPDVIRCFFFFPREAVVWETDGVCDHVYISLPSDWITGVVQRDRHFCLICSNFSHMLV